MLLITLSLLFLVQFDQSYGTAIEVWNGIRFGEWGYMAMCPENATATGFRLKLEPSRDEEDPTPLYGIMLLCEDTIQHSITEVTSLVGQWGQWTDSNSCQQSYLVKFALQVGDTVNNIKVLCNDGTVIEGDRLTKGVYGVWSDKCVNGINGIRSKLDKTRGITNVRFHCVA